MGCSGGASSDEKAAQAATAAAQKQQQAFAQQLASIYQTQLGQQTAVLKTILPQLNEMATNPAGFGPTEYAALQAKIVADTSGQYSSTAKSEAANFATTNEAGLPSGVEESIQANLKGAAGNAVATQSTNLAITNEQLKQQQQQYALSSLSQIQSGIGSEASATAGQSSGTLAGSASTANSEFNQAATIYNQGSLWKNILGGVAGAGLNFLTGGLSGIATQAGAAGASTGQQFLTGAGQALTPQAA
jgi:hypothetical protein